MNELKLGDPAMPDTDIGPVIDAESRDMLQAHLEDMKSCAKVLHQIDAGVIGAEGYGFGPALVELSSLDQITEEKFGPILHVIRYDPDDIEKVGAALHAKGYGLTLGVHSRLDSFYKEVCEACPAGNTYVNRSMIGAVVGVQLSAARALRNRTEGGRAALSPSLRHGKGGDREYHGTGR